MSSVQELNVIQKAKELAEIIFEITDKSPQKFRFSIVQRMQNIALDIISNLYLANDTYIDSKFISDLDVSINEIRRKRKLEKYRHDIFLEKKLYDLKIIKAKQYDEKLSKRLDYSNKALSLIKQLDFIVGLAMKTGCITNKQGNRIISLLYEVRNMTAAFVRSDRQRFEK